MPSGVTTAIPFSTPAVDPRSRNTSFEPAPAPVPITRAASVRDCVCDWNTLSARARSAVESSVRRILILHLEAAEFVRISRFCCRRVAQGQVVAREVVTPLRTPSSVRASGVTAVTAHTRISRTSFPS